MCAVDQKRSFSARAWPFLDLLPFEGPFPLTGALTGRQPYRADSLTGRPLYGEASYRKAFRGITGNTFNYRKAYGKAGPLQEAPYQKGRSLREGPVPYGKGRGPLRVLHREGQPLQEAPYEEGRSRTRRAGPLRERPGSLTRLLTGRPLWGGFLRETPLITGKLTKVGPLREAPYEEGRSLREGPVPYGKAGVPYGSFTEKALTNYRKAYGKLWGEILPELDGNFCLCAVDQKRPFFPRAGPFLDLLPFKGPFSLTGALTGRPLTGRLLTGRLGPYRKPLTRRDGPYGKGRGPVRVLHREGRRRGLREGRALTGSPLRGGTVLIRRAGPYGRAGVPYGSFREGRRRGLREGRALTGSPLALTGRPTYEKASYGEASYRKAPYGEASYGKAPDGEVS